MGFLPTDLILVTNVNRMPKREMSFSMSTTLMEKLSYAPMHLEPIHALTLPSILQLFLEGQLP